MEPGLPDRLLEVLETRFVFVVGKGGVGKTTTAAALALRASEKGTPTRLLSTDPAHSLGDVFEVSLDDESVREGVCEPLLVLEAFDASAYADAWIREASGPVTELFDLGTYLDVEDVASFLDLSLPGLDEVMAALRLGELTGEGAERIVVDTAPTGHTLRLLDSGQILDTWVAALRAMSRKATAVAEGLTHRRIRLAADAFVDDLEAGIRRFEEEVLQEACFVVVTRPDPVVGDETARLESELERRGLRTCVRVVVAAAGGADGGRDRDSGSASGGAVVDVRTFGVPGRADLRGCEGLRRWGREPDEVEGAGAMGATGAAAASREIPGAAPAAEPTPTSVDEDLPADLSALLERPVLLFAGKGGVGKSTCAAAFALAASERGETTLVSTDPAGSLESLFGVEIPDEGVEIEAGLRLRQLDAEAAFERFLERSRMEVERIFEGLGMGREAVLDRDVMESLLELAPPGIDEIVALVVVMELIEEKRGRVVVDAAPTGHFLRLIRMPDVALDWIHSLMRVLLKYRSVVGIARTAERLLELSRRVKELRSLLTDAERTAALLVTLDEPVVMAESRRLRDRVKAAGIPVGAWIRNRAGPGAPPDPEAAEKDREIATFLAPDMGETLRGSGRLRAFLSRWEVVS